MIIKMSYEQENQYEFIAFCEEHNLTPKHEWHEDDGQNTMVEYINTEDLQEPDMPTCEASRIFYKPDREEPTVRITNRTELAEYCIRSHADSALEEGHLICVDANCRVIVNFTVSTGSLGDVSMYPDKIAKIALLANARSVFLSHNHPGGTCAPSSEDIAATLQIKKILRMLNIMVLDHMIVTPDHQSYSLSAHGDITIN